MIPKNARGWRTQNRIVKVAKTLPIPLYSSAEFCGINGRRGMKKFDDPVKAVVSNRGNRRCMMVSYLNQLTS